MNRLSVMLISLFLTSLSTVSYGSSGQLLPSNLIAYGTRLDVRAFGNLSAAKASPATVGKVIVITSRQSVNNLTIPDDRALIVADGGSISVNAGKMLTVSGQFSAGLYNVFTGGGSVKFGTGSVSDVYPQWWGAKTDGSDDTKPIQKALLSHGSVELSKLAYTVKSLSLPTGILKNGTLILTNDTKMTSNSDFTFDNIKIDGNGKRVNTAAVWVTGGSFKFLNSKIVHINSQTEYGNQYGIRIDLNGVKFQIENSLFEDITCVGDANGAETVNGFAGGIIFIGNKSNPLTDYSQPSSGVVSKCTFNNIYTTKNNSWPGKVDYDADAIRFYINKWTPVFKVIFPITISDCRFKDIQKSCIKNAGVNGIVVKNIDIVASRKDIDMLAPIRIQTAYNFKIEGLTFDGAADNLFVLSGQNISLNNISTTTRSTINQGLLFLYRDSTTSAGISAKNMKLNGVKRLIGTINSSSSLTARDVLIKDTYTNVAAANPVHNYIKQFDGLTFENVTCVSASQVRVVDLEDSVNVTFKNCNFASTTSSIYLGKNNIGILNLKISGCLFDKTGTGKGIRAVNIRAMSGAEQTPTGVIIENTKITGLSHNAPTNDEFIIVQANDVVIDNVQCVIKQNSSFVSGPNAAIMCSHCYNVKITNISYSSDFISTAASYAVVVASSKSVTINNIRGHVRRGLWLTGNTGDISYDNVKSKVGELIVVDDATGRNKVAGANLTAEL